MALSDESPSLQEALTVFDFPGTVASVTRYDAGHINESYKVLVHGHPDTYFMVQRINTHVFHDPAGLMANVVAVTDYLRQQYEALSEDPTRRVLKVLPTKPGQSFHLCSDGSAWRAYWFIENTVCYQSTPTPDVFAAAARGFGEFTRLLDDFPANSLYETIPFFHDTRVRFKTFEQAVAEDQASRVKQVTAEIDFARARADQAGLLMDQLDQGLLPLRVTHNDTKLNNILMDPGNHQAVCVVDLDTVMPGLALHDYGDAIRFGASTAAEDEPDLDLVHLDLPLFDAYTSGYLEAMGDSLTDNERQHLPWGAKLITLECGVRFLTDYLQGDTYFRIKRPNQNLDRCRTQFKLVSEMEELFDPLAT